MPDNDTTETPRAVPSQGHAGLRRPVRPHIVTLRREDANLGDADMTQSHQMRICDPTAPASESEPIIVLELQAEAFDGGPRLLTVESQQDLLERAEHQRRAILHRSVEAASSVVRVLPDTAAQLTLELAAINRMIELFSNATRLSAETFMIEWTALFRSGRARELGLRVQELDFKRIAWLFHIDGHTGVESFGRRSRGHTSNRIPYRIQTVFNEQGNDGPAELEATPVQPRSGINGRFELAEVSTPRGRGPLIPPVRATETSEQGDSHGEGPERA